MLMLVFGVIFGAMVALAAVWLWFDYQTDPAHSILAALSTQITALLPAGFQTEITQQTRVMGLPLTGKTSAYWYMSRAGGMVGYILMWLAVVWGLILSTKVTNKMISMPVAYGTHEFLSILSILFATMHAVVLLGDQYIKFNVIHLLLPFSAPYEPLAVGLGTLGLYFSMALTASFYVRKQIGQKVWRWLHYLTFGAYLLVLAHSIMAGTDSKAFASILMYWGSGAVVMFLVYYRLFTLKTKSKPAPAR
jgi:predicted ferric reductase